MTVPYMMNCPHLEDSWCLACVGELGAEAERLRLSISDGNGNARELWRALANLSFHCDGVLCTVPPPREVYNESFAVMDRLKPLYGPEAPK